MASTNEEFKPIPFLTASENQWLENHPIISAQNERDWPPYNFNQDGKPQGYSIDFFNLLAHKLHIQVHYITGKSWKEYLGMLRHGTLDVILNIRKTPKREAWMLFTDPYAEASKSIFSNTPGIHNLSDLRGKRIAVPEGYYIGSFLRRYYPRSKLIHCRNLTQAIYAVVNGKADAVVGDYNAVSTLMQKLGVMLRYATIVQDQRLDRTIRMAVRSDQTILHSILQKTMDQVTSGEATLLRSKWFNSESVKWVDYRTMDLNASEIAFLRSHPVITMCNNPNWTPIEFLDEKGRMAGIAIDTLRWIEEKLHIRFRHVPTRSWSQSQQYLKAKKCMILPAAIKTPKRERYALFTRPYLRYDLAIITRKDAPFVRNLDDLKGKVFARKKGSGLISKMRRLYPGIKILETDNYLESFQAVMEGKADYTIATLPVAAYFISRYQLNDLAIAGYTRMRYDLSIAVRKDLPLLASILDKALAAFPPEKGKAIFNKWTNIHISRKAQGIDPRIVYALMGVGGFVLLFGGFWYYQLRKSAQEARELLDATIEGVILLKNGKVVDVNQSILKLLGYDHREEMIGKRFFDWVAPESLEAVREHYEKTYDTPYEVILLRADNTPIHTLIFGRNIRKKSLRLVNVVDISRLKEQEHIIAQQSKLASMGEMIGNIAHQWRQPLSVISAIATGIKIKKVHNKLDDHEFSRQCDEIKHQVNFLSQTIDDFRDFIRGTHVLKSYQIQEVIAEFSRLVHGSIEKHGIRLIIHNRVSSELIGYPNELVQCLLNLYSNAKDAFKNNETERIILLEAEENGDGVKLTFTDSGGGIDDTILPRIFDPYFTTKHQAQGTGLGLYMTHQLLQGMGGRISVKNRHFTLDMEEQFYFGASFVIHLPRQIREKENDEERG
ncbi:transporter substrate-binding domain-containing protein [Nitratifractor sp.]|uniref:transporter substrate-binding domain-containing protein n=1 Tax=Nitratifractor sp. TaxID=2268144 RepID=UPI0026014A91|nr:transporter substrate-binding domain-containing protein [Nitratifractor sp.]